MKTSDILFVGAVLLLALSMRCYKETGEFATLPTKPSVEIVVAGNNKTIEILIEGIERRGMAKPRQAAPPMPKSYPVRTPPKSATKTK